MINELKKITNAHAVKITDSTDRHIFFIVDNNNYLTWSVSLTKTGKIKKGSLSSESNRV